MRTVVLARNDTEGRAFARASGMVPNSGIIVAGSLRSLDGIVLNEADLVAEFEGFREREDWQDIVNALRRKFIASGPRWERIGKPRPLL